MTTTTGTGTDTDTGSSNGTGTGTTGATAPPSGPAHLRAAAQFDGGAMLRHLLPGLALNVALPLIVYVLLRPRLHSDVGALAVGAAIPAVVTLVGFAVRRRVDRIGVVAVAAFAMGLLLFALSGGNPLVLKLHDAVLTGPLGLVCLVSVLVRRPLLLFAARLAMGRRSAAGAPAVDPRGPAVLTAILGTMLFVHALLLLVLALTLPTSTFLAAGRPAGWVVIALGVAALAWYRSRLRNRASVNRPG